MGHPPIISDPATMKRTFNAIQNFVCALYNVKAVKTVTETRSVILDGIYKPSRENEQFRKNTAKLKVTTFSPSYQKLEQQITRGIYNTHIWCNVNFKNPTTLTPINYGWKLIDMKYGFH